MIKKTPLRMQVNPIECGAAVLGIILGYYKHNISMHQLNNLVGVSRFGTDARALMRAAEFLGLKAYAQKILVSDLKKTHSLSVLFVDNSHFVVFEGYFWGRFYINDPALGRYSLNAEQLRRRLSGMQIVLEPAAQLGKNTRYDFLGKFIGALGIIFGALSGVLIVIFTSSLALNITESVKYLSLIVFFLLALTLFAVIFVKISHLKLKNIYAHMLSSWMLAHISQSGSSFFTTRPFAGFARALKNLSTLNIINLPRRSMSIIICAVMLVIILGLAFIYWPFALIGLVLCVMSWALAREKGSSRDLTLPHCAQAYEHYPDLSAMGQNHQLVNAQITFTARAYAQSDFARINYFSFIPMWLALPMVFYGASLSIEQGSLTTLEVYGVLILIIFLSYLAGALARNSSMPQEEQDNAFLSEIGDRALFMRNKSEIHNSEYLVEIIDGDFIYPGEAKAIFKEFSLILERSKIYVVKAMPMAGVSTLLKLIGQKLLWTKGEQRLERQNLRIALIDDEADLFEGSLLENIRLFDRQISEDKVVIALNHACAQELFYQRPMGLLAFINAGGANVSGGQKKRLLLARALVHKPDLIILDDFFETLELELALKILSNLRTLNVSVIFSSQRPQEYEFADEIITWSRQP